MISQDQAVAMLVQLFDNNKLSFREIELLRQVFDQAVAACDEDRAETEADYRMGRGAHPTLPSRTVEEEFRYTMEAQAQHSLARQGIQASDRALAAIADFAIETAEFETKDFYHFR
jgi:hypothetical protein